MRLPCSPTVSVNHNPAIAVECRSIAHKTTLRSLLASSDSSLTPVTIYTDGACSGNPGPGGYGVVLLYGELRKELSAGFQRTTNNRMELLATIVGLEALKKTCAVTLYTDSKYIVDAMQQGWAKRWRANGWKRNQKEMAKNPDLWERLLDIAAQHQVNFCWVKGHAGNVENERCDRLAVAASRGAELMVDTAYAHGQA